jgi:23S rRNA (pseudouridine1915-N3)-methyltransferase
MLDLNDWYLSWAVHLDFLPKMYEKANGLLSMSEMTTSHQLIRVVFLEQIYRAFTILNNEPYHND